MMTPRPATIIMCILAIPCIVDMVMWGIVFINPRLGFREDLTNVFVAIYSFGWFAALGGVFCAIAFGVISSSRKAVIVVFLVLFIGVMLLNVFGFFWSLGVGVNAFS